MYIVKLLYEKLVIFIILIIGINKCFKELRLLTDNNKSLIPLYLGFY